MLTWQSAARCAGSDQALWWPTFDPPTLGGEGIYQLQFRAIDAVGHVTTSPIVRVQVDDTAPTAATPYNHTWQPRAAPGKWGSGVTFWSGCICASSMATNLTIWRRSWPPKRSGPKLQM
jgi:hypothetical protein